jgi:hypothetical protein
MQTGWIKLYRKLLNHEIFKSKDDKLFKTFIYCLLRAGHKEREIFFNKQKVKLKPGQFITSRNNASRDLGFSPKTFDRKIQILQREDIMTRIVRDESDPQNGTKVTQNLTHRFSVISITNWETYQGRPEEDDPEPDPKHDPQKGTKVTTNKKYKEEKKNPGAISSEISSLVSQVFSFPGGEETYSKMIQAISQTRKAGKVSQGVILSLLKSLEKHPQERVRGGIQIYLEKAYHTQRKGEKYLLGIVRNHGPGETPLRQEFKSTGSPALDDYYRKQAEGKA